MDSEKKDLFDLLAKRHNVVSSLSPIDSEIRDILFDVLDVDSSYGLNIDYKDSSDDLEFQLLLGKWLDTVDFKRLFDSAASIGFFISSIWAEDNQIKLYFSIREDEQ